MLRRVEHEYALHLFDHGFMPGKRCAECDCVCGARADVACVAAKAAMGNKTNTTRFELSDSDSDFDACIGDDDELDVLGTADDIDYDDSSAGSCSADPVA